MSYSYIPKDTRDKVSKRQKHKCACCLERGEEFHHVRPQHLDKHSANNFDKNIVLLCKNHHLLFHSGDPDTFQTIYEYVWFLYKNKLPEKDSITVAREVREWLDKDFLKIHETIESYKNPHYYPWEI